MCSLVNRRINFVVVLGGITNSLNCLFVKRSISIPNGFIVFDTKVHRLASRTDSCLNPRGHAPDHSEGLIATDEDPRTRVADASEGAPHAHLADESEEGGLFEDLAGIGNVNNDNAALGIRMLSPILPAQDERNSDVNGGGHQGEEEDFPSRLTCLINYEPPAVAVFFDIPDTNGQISGQVVEESALF